MLLIFLHVINICFILDISEKSVVGQLFFALFLSSTIFTILFLPSYPVFFIIFKKKDFNFLEKLGLTITIDLSFYIIMGYLGFFLGFPITAHFFLSVLIITFSSIISWTLIYEYRNGLSPFLKAKNSPYRTNEDYKNFSIIAYIKKLVPQNSFLLIVFLLLICVFNVVRFEYFFGTDPWLHIFIAKSIVEMNYLPLEEYYGSVGLPIFTAVIHFFSGVNFILIPRFFIFYTIPLSALIFYNFLKRIFKSRNLSLFGVFILEFSGLGFAYMMYQFWPSHLAIILLLTIFFLLYVRLERFLKLERPTKREILSNMSLIYVLITILFITALFTHVLTSIILLLSLIWILLIYFIKDYKRGFDFLFLCGLFGIFLIFLNFGLSAEHFYFLDRASGESLPFMFLIGLMGIGTLSVIIIWRLKKSILFTKGRFKEIIKGKKSTYYQAIEDKYVIPLAFSIILVLTVLYFIGNLLIFKLPITSILTGVEVLLLIAFAIWGIILYQKKPRGKPFFIWVIFLAVFFLAVFMFDILLSGRAYWARVFYLIAPFTVIGFISYVYKLVRSNSLQKIKPKLFLIFLIFFSLSVTYYHEFTTVQYVSMTRRQVGGAQWYCGHTSDGNVIVTEFGFNYMFMYYDYPYEDGDEDLRGRDIHLFIDSRDNLFDPDEHINDDGENVLQEIKEEEETDVILTLDDQYYYNQDWETYGYLSEEEMEEYYELEYLNKIYSARSEDGEENAYYWVI